MQFGVPTRVLNATNFLHFNPITNNSVQSLSDVRFRSRRPLFIPFGKLDLTCKAATSESGSAAPLVKIMSGESFDELSSLTSLSPLDGQYRNEVNDLSPYLSEFGLIYFRVLVEIKWLIKLSEIAQVNEVPSFTEEALSYLQAIIDGFSINDAMEVKNIEKVTNHDVKAVEYFLKQKCQSNSEIAKVIEFFHFACTSEDINNLAHGLMLKEVANEVMFPVMDDMIKAIFRMAEKYSKLPMPSHTHGQIATPTTLGKEMAIFAYRLSEEKREISHVKILGKCAGAVGNYNAHYVAYPDVNWPQVAKEFVTSLGLSFNPYVTQIESHDYMAALFHEFKQFNSIVIDFNRDVTGYIKLGFFKQITKADFEYSEGNLVVANGSLSHLGSKLPISRWQRDLTDSTALRTLGTVLGHCLLGYKSSSQGIAKLEVSKARLNDSLNQSWELLAEPIQTVMRKYSVPEPYEKLKALTRGKTVNEETIREFVQRLDIPQEAKSSLLKLKPQTYIGIGDELACTDELTLNINNGYGSQISAPKV